LLFIRASLDHNPPIYASHSSCDDRHAPVCPTSGWDGGLADFLPRQVLNCNPFNLFPEKLGLRCEPPYLAGSLVILRFWFSFIFLKILIFWKRKYSC
jgi:hypothetical protein